MKRRLLTPVIENMTDADIISSRGVLRTGAPARAATSASPVQSTTRCARIASRPALLSVMTPRIAPSREDRRDEQSMQHRLDARFLHQHVGDPLEHLRVERVADRLRLRHGRAHRLGALLELDADAFAVDRLLVPVPGEALDADLRDVAAEAAVALEQRGLHAGARGRERRGEAARAAADDEHLRLVDDVDFARGFSDSLACRAARPVDRAHFGHDRRARRRARTTRRIRRRSAPTCSCRSIAPGSP